MTDETYMTEMTDMADKADMTDTAFEVLLYFLFLLTRTQKIL